MTRYSEVQIDLWRVREELGREVAGMTTEQLRQYFGEARRDFEAETGAKLEVVARTEAPSTRDING
ncbi:MAG: hypothetical protein WBF17_24780 [Phycisphaerae bacterium]